MEKCPDAAMYPWGDPTASKADLRPFCGPKFTDEVLNDDAVSVKDLIKDHIWDGQKDAITALLGTGAL